MKGKFTYNGREIALDREASWIFGNDFGRNVIFSVDNDSSSHTNNQKITF